MQKTLKGMCESCLMPFRSDPLGVNREHEKYCSYCFANGDFTYKGSYVREFKKQIVDAMVAKGSNPLTARFFAFLAGFAPRWKK